MGQIRRRPRLQKIRHRSHRARRSVAYTTSPHRVRTHRPVQRLHLSLLRRCKSSSSWARAVVVFHIPIRAYFCRGSEYRGQFDWERADCG